MAISLKVSTIDKNSKPTSMTIGVDAGATNIELQAVVDAVAAIIRGPAPSGVKTTSETIDGGDDTPPADKEAVRENKWLLRMSCLDGNGDTRILSHEIGTADNTNLPSPSDDFLDLTAGVGLALKTAVEAVYLSLYGTTGTLISVQQIGRSG